MNLSLRSLLLLPALLLAAASHAQTINILEGDTIFLCEPGPVTLHAVYLGADSSDLQSSEPLSTIDDAYSELVDLGFPFTFYGNTHTQCVLSTNFYITFELSEATPAGAGWPNFSPWNILTNAPSYGTPALSAIMGPWQDTYPGANPASPGWISYTTVGDAPNRIFIFNMCMVPMFSCTDSFFSGQIKLFETTNDIEFHIAEKTICDGWNEGGAILGVQDGNLADIVLNYSTPWTSFNEAWRLSPNGPGAYTITTIPYDPVQVYATNQLQWNWPGMNPVYSDTLVIDVQQSGWAHVSFFGCFGTSLTAGGSDSIYIALNYTDFTQSRRVSACNNPDENALFMNFPTNVNGPYDIVWTDSLGTALLSNTGVLDIDSLPDIPAGTYHAMVTNAIGCTFDYTFVMPVREMVPSFTYYPNPLICQYEPVALASTSTGFITDYQWNFGDGNSGVGSVLTHPYMVSGDSIPVTLLITNDTFPSCAFDTTLYIDIHPNIAAQFYTSPLLCPETYIGFYDASYPYPVSWEWTVDGVPVSSDSMMYQYFAVGGSYTVSLAVTDSLCGADTLTDVLVLYDFPIVEIGNDTLLCPGETVTLNAGNPGMTYQWSTGQQSQIINLQVDQTTFVSVTVSNNGCERGDVIMVEMNCSLNFPNAFSPNGDGRNDFFTPHLVNMETYRMYIYNRWGELVYTMDNGLGNENEGWDGFYKNQPAPMGVYVYYATGTTIRGQSVQAQGNVALLR